LVVLPPGLINRCQSSLRFRGHLVSWRRGDHVAEKAEQHARIEIDKPKVVTVDIIANRTDIDPLKIVVSIRAAKSCTFFERTNGYDVRLISVDDLNGITLDAGSKDQFVIVDCVGMRETGVTDFLLTERRIC